MVVDNGLPDISASRATPSPTPAYPQVASSLPKHSSRTGSNITRLPPLQSSAEDDLLERERQLEDNLQQIEERMSLREQAWRLKKEGNEKAAQHAKYELDIRTTKKARWSVDSKGKLVREEGRAAPRTTASDNGGTEEELMELKERFKNLMVPHPPCRGSPSGSSQRSNGSPHQIYTSPTGRHYLGPGSSKSDSPRTEFKAAPTVFSWTDPSGEEEVAMVWEGYTDAGRADAPARPRRSAVSSQVLQVEETEIFEPRAYPKNAAELEKLKCTLALNPLFMQLDSDDLQIVMDAMRHEAYEARANILQQGQISDCFYVVSSGVCHVHKDGQLVAILKDGQCFGELELMYHSKCRATVNAVTDVELWALGQDVYRQIVMQVSIQKRRLYEDLLLRVSALKTMDHYQLLVLADALQPAFFESGSHLIHYGEVGGWMHIIVEGQVEVLGRNNFNEPVHVCEFGWGDCVGELEFLYSHPCVADVVAITDVKTVRLHRDHFEMCMGPVAGFLKDRAEEDVAYTYYQQRKKETVAFNFAEDTSFLRMLDSETGTACEDVTRDMVPEELTVYQRRRESYQRRVGITSARTPVPENYEPVVVEKTPEQLALLKQSLMLNPLFGQMRERELRVILDAMQPGRYRTQEQILTQGEEGYYYQVIMSGECMCTVDGALVKTFGPGETFGELELMYETVCRASITAKTDVETFMLDRVTYRQIVIQMSVKKRALYSQLLSKVDILSAMTPSDLNTLADALQWADFGPGDKIIEYGTPGMWMHIILEGTVEVQGRDDTGRVIEVCELSVGDPIGELEFLHKHDCVADVVAKTHVETVRLNREHFDMCMGPVLDALKERENQPEYRYYCALDFEEGLNKFRMSMSPDDVDDQEHTTAAEDNNTTAVGAAGAPRRERLTSARQRRVAVAAAEDEEESDGDTLPPSPSNHKTDDTLKSLSDILSTNPLFSNLEQADLDAMVTTMTRKSAREAEVVLQQGTENSKLYIIEVGTVQVLRDGEELASFGPGRFFGELELMYNAKCRATVKTTAECKFWIMDGKVYRRKAKKLHTEKRALYQELLQGVELLKSLTEYDRLILADALQPSHYSPGDRILRFGDDPEWMHIILEGEVEVWGRDGDGSVVNVCRFGYGDTIGELEFMNNHKCVADVVAATDVKTVKLKRNHFEMCMGPIIEILKDNIATETYSYYTGFDWSQQDDMAAFIDQVTAEELRRGYSDKNLPLHRTESSHSTTSNASFSAPMRPRQPQGPKPVGRPRPRRVAVASTVAVEPRFDDDFTPVVFEKSEEDHRMLKVLLMKKALFSHLEDRDMDMVVDSMEMKTFQKGEVMVHDQMMGDSLYVIMSGKCVKKCFDKPDEIFSRGACFGEEQLMYSSKHSFEVDVIDTVECYTLNRSHYQMIATRISKMRRELYEELLSNVSFLQSMTHEDLLTLADCLQPAHFSEGDYIIKFGSQGEWMHIIIDGIVEVWGRDGRTTLNVCEFGYGDPIGELEFINNHKCVADVVAKTEVKTVKLNRNHFELCMGPVVDVLKKHAQTETYRYYTSFDWSQSDFTQRLLRDGEETPSSDDRSSDSGTVPWRRGSCKRRSGVTSRRVEQYTAENFLPTVVPKSMEERGLIVSAMQSKPLFGHLELDDLQTLADVMVKKVYHKGDCIMKQGAEDEHFYVIADGECKFVERDKGMHEFGPGDCFGELELMYQSACLATVTVSSDHLIAYQLDRTTYRSVVMQVSIQKRSLYQELLSNVSILKSMTQTELLNLADALQPEDFKQGEYLIKFREPGEYMFIILTGEVDVIGRGDFGKPLHVCTFGYGHPVGELEFINNHVCVADVVAKTDVKTAKLSRRHFELVMGPVVDVLKRNAEQPVYTYYNKTLALVRSGSFDEKMGQPPHKTEGGEA